MGNSITMLLKRIDRMIEKLEPPAKTWVLVLEVGQGIPDHILPLIAPHDRVVIQEIPVGYLGEEIA